MGWKTLGSANTIGSLDMKRVARWLMKPDITPLQRQGRLAGFSQLCTLSRTAWKRLGLIQLQNVRHNIKGITI